MGLCESLTLANSGADNSGDDGADRTGRRNHKGQKEIQGQKYRHACKCNCRFTLSLAFAGLWIKTGMEKTDRAVRQALADPG